MVSRGDRATVRQKAVAIPALVTLRNISFQHRNTRENHPKTRGLLQINKSSCDLCLIQQGADMGRVHYLHLSSNIPHDSFLISKYIVVASINGQLIFLLLPL